MTKEEGRVGRRRKFVTPWKKAAQEVGDGGAEDRVERLAAAASSSTALSPRVTLDGSNVGGKRGKKRKSPCVAMPFFRTPLSRMLLSPSIRIRSPSIQQRTSPSATTHGICQGREQRTMDIDLNLEPGDTYAAIDPGEAGFDHSAATDAQGNGEAGFDHSAATDAQGNGEAGFDPFDSNADDDVLVTLEEIGVDPGQENVQPQFDPFFDSDVDDAILVPQENTHKNVVLDNDKQRAIFDAMLVKARKGYLKGHESKEVSAKFSVPIRTVQRIWKKGKSCLDQGISVDVASGRSRCGRKKKVVDVSCLEDISILSRTTIQDVATQLGVSTSKVYRMKKEGAIKRVSSSLDPHLTDQHKIDRLKWCIEMLDPRSVPHNLVFKPLFDFIFIDEKWFNITRKTVRYYVAPTASRRIRTIQNKNFIPKIMILTALARPRFDSNGKCIFDGKIGCFPFVTYTAAKRSSVNRPAGTIEMKPIESITKEVIRSFMIEKVLPAVRAKWPREDAGKPIYIQQDNARPHIAPDDRMFCEAAKQDGFNIKLVCQPTNSPDLNVLDLGFFNSIQSIQYKSVSTTTEELVAAIDRAFEDYPVRLSNRIFLSLHACMREVIEVLGDNSYDLPHIKKGVLERQGRLPLQLRCDAKSVNNANNYLRLAISIYKKHQLGWQQPLYKLAEERKKKGGDLWQWSFSKPGDLLHQRDVHQHRPPRHVSACEPAAAASSERKNQGKALEPKPNREEERAAVLRAMMERTKAKARSGRRTEDDGDLPRCRRQRGSSSGHGAAAALRRRKGTMRVGGGAGLERHAWRASPWQGQEDRRRRSSSCFSAPPTEG
uniref:Transposon protein, putative, Mariner sub-class n=1 Tax=Oryza sativa subsp. japonica TaxID=39947 RepID=Q10SS9_ORYSJ|nr:transposon protein, putative, Mariner sub-class [Oryza sativa Japonica Group]